MGRPLFFLQVTAAELANIGAVCEGLRRKSCVGTQFSAWDPFDRYSALFQDDASYREYGLGVCSKLTKRIYVGNLSFEAYEEDVRELFSQHGNVESVRLITDRATGRFRGFGFVEMDDDGAAAAIQALDGREFQGRNLKVNEARDRDSRPPRRSW